MLAQQQTVTRAARGVDRPAGCADVLLPRASQKEIPIRRVTSSVESQEIVVQTAGQIDGLSCGRLEPGPIEPQ